MVLEYTFTVGTLGLGVVMAEEKEKTKLLVWVGSSGWYSRKHERRESVWSVWWWRCVSNPPFLDSHESNCD